MQRQSHNDETQELRQQVKLKVVTLKKLLEQRTVLERAQPKREICEHWYEKAKISRFNEDNIASLNADRLRAGINKLDKCIGELKAMLEFYSKEASSFTQLQKHTFSFLKAYVKNLNDRPFNDEMNFINRRLVNIQFQCEKMGETDITAYSILVDEYRTQVDSLQKAVERLETQKFLSDMEQLMAQRKSILATMKKHNLHMKETNQKIEGFVKKLKEEFTPLSLSYIQELRDAYNDVLTEDYQNFLKMTIKECIKTAQELIHEKKSPQEREHFYEKHRQLFEKTEDILQENPNAETLERLVKDWKKHIAESRKNKKTFSVVSSYSPRLHQPNKKPNDNNNGLKSILKKTPTTLTRF